MYFLTSNSRLNEQVVDKIILQLNRVYPQILTNAEAEKVIWWILPYLWMLHCFCGCFAQLPRAASPPHLWLAGQLSLGSRIRGEVTGLARFPVPGGSERTVRAEPRALRAAPWAPLHPPGHHVPCVPAWRVRWSVLHPAVSTKSLMNFSGWLMWLITLSIGRKGGINPTCKRGSCGKWMGLVTSSV